MAGWLDSIFGSDAQAQPDQSQPQPGMMGMLNDPRVLAMLGAGAGIAKGAQPYMSYSRLPQSSQGLRAGAIAGLGEGLLGGIQAGTQQQQAQQNLATGGIGLADKLFQLNQIRVALKMPQLSMDDVRSGNYDMKLPADLFKKTGLAADQSQPAQPTSIVGREQPPDVPGSAPPPNGSAAPTMQPPQQPPQLSPNMAPGTAPLPGGIGGTVASGAPPPQSQMPPPAQPPMGAAPPQQQPPQGGAQPVVGVPAMPPQGGAPLALPNIPGYDPFELFQKQKLQPEAYKAIVDNYFKNVYGDHRANSVFTHPLTNQIVQAPAGGITGVSGQPGDPDYNRRVTALGTAQEAPKLAAQMALQNQKYTQETGEAPPGSPASLTSAPRIKAQPIGGNPLPPKTVPQGSVPPQRTALTGENVITDRGTVVPSTVGNQTMGQGTTDINEQIKDSRKTSLNWDKVRSQGETARDRLFLSASLLSGPEGLQGNALNEWKAQASARLRAFGLGGVADHIMTASNTVGVQTLLWNSMQESMSALKEFNSGTGGRILNSEFNAFMDKGFSPEMLNPTLYTAITHQLAAVYQTTNMLDDWHGVAQPMKWRDANQFQSAYLRLNPIEGFVRYIAGDGTTPGVLPKFTGMEGAPGAPPPTNVPTHRFVPGKGVVPVSP